MPFTCGAAMLVPLSAAYGDAVDPFPRLTEIIDSPGAVTLGLSRPSRVGPNEIQRALRTKILSFETD